MAKQKKKDTVRYQLKRWLKQWFDLKMEDRYYNR